MIMASGLNHGVRASVPHLLGISFGAPALFLAIGFGLGYLFERFEWLHLTIQIAGVTYLVYLAFLIAKTRPASISAKSAPPLTFFQAALFQWVNPKAWIMGTSALATYSVVGAEPVWQVIAIVMVFFAFTIPAVGAWLVFGAALQRLLSDAKYHLVFNRTMAVLLILSVFPVLQEWFYRLVG